MEKALFIVDYDPTWRVTFEKSSGRIRYAMHGIPAEVEHVGSTAVPGLAAKPIIDIDLVVPSVAELPEAIGRLEVLGYVHEGDLGITGREAFRAPPGDPNHHLYLCTADSPALRAHRLFRDRLRGDASLARRYAELKRRLATRFVTDRDAYTEAKTAFVREVLAAKTSWK